MIYIYIFIVKIVKGFKADLDSDVDFLVDLEMGRSLLDLGGLLMDLQELLGCRVDVVTEKGLRQRIRDRVLREAVAQYGAYNVLVAMGYSFVLSATLAFFALGASGVSSVGLWSSMASMKPLANRTPTLIWTGGSQISPTVRCGD